MRLTNEKEDDPESQYHSYGIGTGFDSEILFINIGKFVEQLEHEIETVCDEDFDYSGYKKLVEFLKEYEDYNADWKKIEDEKAKVSPSQKTGGKNG